MYMYIIHYTVLLLHVYMYVHMQQKRIHVNSVTETRQCKGNIHLFFHIQYLKVTIIYRYIFFAILDYYHFAGIKFFYFHL